MWLSLTYWHANKYIQDQTQCITLKKTEPWGGRWSENEGVRGIQQRRSENDQTIELTDRGRAPRQRIICFN